jgi:Protein of unknown function (DUF3558)
MVGMHTTRTAAIAALAAAGGFLLAACGGSKGAPVPPPTAPQSSAALVGFDACKVLTSDELQAYGVKSDEQDPLNQQGDVGCTWPGKPFSLGLAKSNNGLSYWQSQGNFAQVHPNQVGARNGLSGIVNGSQGQGDCEEIVDAGGGSVTVQVGDFKSGDPCAKALEIAQKIEPKLPK